MEEEISETTTSKSYIEVGIEEVLKAWNTALLPVVQKKYNTNQKTKYHLHNLRLDIGFVTLEEVGYVPRAGTYTKAKHKIAPLFLRHDDGVLMKLKVDIDAEDGWATSFEKVLIEIQAQLMRHGISHFVKKGERGLPDDLI